MLSHDDQSKQGLYESELVSAFKRERPNLLIARGFKDH
jgi:hypothetical protein